MFNWKLEGVLVLFNNTSREVNVIYPSFYFFFIFFPLIFIIFFLQLHHLHQLQTQPRKTEINTSIFFFIFKIQF